MKYLGLFGAVVFSAAFAVPASAGQPDNPGTGGRLLSSGVQQTIIFGKIPGQVITESGQKPAETIDVLNDLHGGWPNPENDNGQGND